MAKYEGYCSNCNFEAGRTAIKNHIMKEHNEGQYVCYLMRAEGDWKGSPYWLLFSAPKELSLDQVDDFLRYEWCECCGHMSSFYSGRGHDEIEMDMHVASFIVGDTFRYEYDFGSTTRIKLTVVDEILSEEKAVMLLAKNEIPEHKCTFCGDEADHIYFDWQVETYACDQCSEKEENEEFDWLPVVNSPRMGICGYTGEGGFNLKPPFRDVDLKSPFSIDEDDDFDVGGIFRKFAELTGGDLANDLLGLSEEGFLDFQNELLDYVGLPSLEELREDGDVNEFLVECEEMKPMSEAQLMQFIEDGDFYDLNAYAKHLEDVIEILNGLTPEEAEGFDFSEIYATHEVVQKNAHLFAKDDGLSKRSELVSKVLQLFGGDEDFDG